MTLHPCFQPAFPLLPIPTPLHIFYFFILYIYIKIVQRPTYSRLQQASLRHTLTTTFSDLFVCNQLFFFSFLFFFFNLTMLVPIALKKRSHKRSVASSTTLRANFCPHWEAEKERGGGGGGGGGGRRPVVASTKCHWTKSRIDEVSLDEKSHRRTVDGRTVASTKCRRGNKYRRAVKAFGVLNSTVPEYHP